ncbi:protein GPR107 [Diorhabda sublineata]|uniref:protein GPR107 n=1 Tax=Diorhabda sublineata TaxID=1163346 RepID=UPI0024E05DF4|nr:protein GPR107 [Diorhabda sublineata]
MSNIHVNYIAVVLFGILSVCSARKHNLEITNDARRYIPLSNFGFYKGGYLEVELSNFTVNPENISGPFGFSLDKTINDGVNPYLNGHEDHCLLERISEKPQTVEIIFLILNFQTKELVITCNGKQNHVHIFKQREENDKENENSDCKDLKFKLTSTEYKGRTYYNTSFVMAVRSLEEEGLYTLIFHNCPVYKNIESRVDFNIKIVEQNPSSYLSAGDMPLPALYCMMSILFLLSGMFWVFLLKQSRHPVFKIHYMMAVLVFLKAVSLAFHGVNYHYIERLGVHLATWAILFYIAHLLKGALLFVVIVLVGTGWTFVKHVLTPRDKKLFMVVIPLQVLANVADIILEESEESAREYVAWKNFVILVDLLCCGCILFPVVWSIRHLQEASQTDGKIAMNLRKLKLFRHFYVMVVCYIYTTRIIVYLLKMTVPFQYGWLHEMFKEMATYVFFVLTAYKFRPASQNPYFALTEDDDDEIEILTTTGVTEGLSNINSRTTKTALHQHTLTEVTEEEKDVLLGQKESSHEYD